MTVNDLVTEAMDEVGADSTDSTLEAKFLKFFKSTLRRLSLKARNRFLTNIISKTLASAAQTITLNTTDYFNRERHIYREASGRRIPIDKIGSVRTFDANYSSSNSGAPQFYRWYNELIIEFDRAADQEYTILIDAFVEVDAVTLATTWTASTAVAEIIKDGVKWYYAIYNEESGLDPDKFQRLFVDGIAELDSQYMNDEMPSHIEEY